jgi:hypothetical protein
MAETTTQIDELLKEILSKPQEGVEEKEAPEGEEDLKRLSQQAPPSRGLCRRCGENKPVNRLMLCYPCWVKTNLEEKGWRQDQPHPDWCECTLTDHGRRTDGN